ncbi:hypothetical protein CAPTEDRAFT_218496 [Capitella teleta]|uniref:Uncharacterized protein n=1 Tax=Capitella teleta TaxID=283909 RepID=R7VM24_CAPTE|nr:hypothetical protein CAPTEDRAFT_218496 [Capitella teleta]|eukprot:ELU18766.1 hypothetical protein CAPTEDRAFT_218496 [Capitella teleta]
MPGCKHKEIMHSEYRVNMKSSANLPYMYRSHKMCGIVRLDLTGTFAWLSGFSVELSIHSDVWCPELGGLIPKLRTQIEDINKEKLERQIVTVPKQRHFNPINLNLNLNI